MIEPFSNHSRNGLSRRDFARSLATTGLAVGVGVHAWAGETKSGDMLYRTLGRTGEKVSAIGLGGYHIGTPRDEEESIRLIRGAIDRGITFMDNCWDYLDGTSETRMGKALRDGYRDKVFLMTKIDGRTKRAQRSRLTSACSGCRPTALTSCSTTRSSAWKTRTASLA